MADPHPHARGQRPLHTAGALAASVLLLVGSFLVWQGATGVEERDPGPAPSAAGETDDRPRVRRASGVAGPTARSEPGVPRRIAVPALGVEAAVDPIRLSGTTLVPPGGVHRVGWWSGGARPGATTGSALLTGHTVHTGGGVFDRLGELTRGDRVDVGVGGRDIAYEVRSVWSMSTQELARRHERLFRQHGRGRLVLVTCTGWDGKAYRGSVVVLATPVGPSA